MAGGTPSFGAAYACARSAGGFLQPCIRGSLGRANGGWGLGCRLMRVGVGGVMRRASRRVRGDGWSGWVSRRGERGEVVGWRRRAMEVTVCRDDIGGLGVSRPTGGAPRSSSGETIRGEMPMVGSAAVNPGEDETPMESRTSPASPGPGHRPSCIRDPRIPGFARGCAEGRRRDGSDRMWSCSTGPTLRHAVAAGRGRVVAACGAGEAGVCVRSTRSARRLCHCRDGEVGRVSCFESWVMTVLWWGWRAVTMSFRTWWERTWVLESRGRCTGLRSFLMYRR